MGGVRANEGYEVWIDIDFHVVRVFESRKSHSFLPVDEVAHNPPVNSHLQTVCSELHGIVSV